MASRAVAAGNVLASGWRRSSQGVTIQAELPFGDAMTPKGFGAIIDQLRKVHVAVTDGEHAAWMPDDVREEVKQLLDACDQNPTVARVVMVELDRRRRARAA
jgi:hypothetical protein